jgi:regulator of ribonuclease activity A
VFEDNQLVRDQVTSDGEGKVLVIDGGASMQRALLGDMLAAKAVENGWNGIIINGCIRDSEDMAYMKLGVLALGTHPLKTVKAGVGKTNVSITFAGLNFEPADFIYVDIDGIVISEKPLT